jgi:hypothetical protein
MSRGHLVVTVALVSAVPLLGATAAKANPPGEPLGTHISECARLAVGHRVDPPAVTCTDDGHVHRFATFGELVAHVREHDG